MVSNRCTNCDEHEYEICTSTVVINGLTDITLVLLSEAMSYHKLILAHKTVLLISDDLLRFNYLSDRGSVDEIKGL